ncbi:MAG: bifunctional demethylmenaquinone methyltransferase/2-methoxy-6-polyprenyl-1,4-benzoquinol methylase UbiE [Bacteroidia bacterium]
MATVTPYNHEQPKKEQVAEMFNNIAFRYDFLNSLLSLGIHKGWRKKAVAVFKNKKPQFILDVASGTGDFAIESLKADPQKVTGVDISAGMLEIGKQKIKKLNLENKIELQLADAEHLPFADNYFDVITVGFGVRNFENLEAGLKEMQRVLKPGGDLVIIEFSKPSGLFSYLYKFYFSYITPAIGKLFSKDHRAYSYLPESVEAFPYGKALCEILTMCGYTNAKAEKLTSGVASIYTASK